MTTPRGPRPLLCGFSITLRHTLCSRTPVDEWDLYLKTHNIYKRRTSIPQAGLEPEIPASEWLLIEALERGYCELSVWDYLNRNSFSSQKRIFPLGIFTPILYNTINLVNEADRSWCSDPSSSYCGLLFFEAVCERLEEHHISPLKMEVMCPFAALLPTF
jgi:hypothetical protein